MKAFTGVPYCTALTLRTDLTALNDLVAFVALVTRVAAGLRLEDAFAPGALGLTFFVAIRFTSSPSMLTIASCSGLGSERVMGVTSSPVTSVTG
jgi:hypothetical protein